MLIEGVVTHQNFPITNVNVLVKGTSNGVRTNQEGKYSIRTNIENILIYSHVEMRTLEITLNEGVSILNVELELKVEELDEVVVKKKRALSQKELLAEYPFNKGLIKTSQGIIDKDLASFSMQIIDGNNLIPVGTDFLYSLQNLYPQMKVIRNPDLEPRHINPKVYLQNWSSGSKPTAIFDVDGFIHEIPPIFMQVEDIERMVILNKSGAISRYGSQGAGGVIIINTKSKTWLDNAAINKTYDNSDLRDSLIRVVNKKDLFVESSPDYMKAFNSVISEQQAQEVFALLKLEHGDSPYYFLEVSNYFKKQWKNNKKASELLHMLENRFPYNVAALKAAAYAHEGMNHSKNALAIYLKILKLESNKAQSHRDVANAYWEIDDYQEALRRYARYELATNELDTIAFDPYGTDLLMTTETNNLIKLKGKEFFLDKKTIDGTLNNPSTRLLFEWNQKNAEYEIQIVTPDGSYYTWENTIKSDDILLLNHRIKGYTSKQFFLDDDLKGEWQVNINYFGAKSKAPTYLKFTVYFDYGKPTQKMVLNIFKLTERHIDMSLLRIDTSMLSISK